jgi:hypothetical protein
MVTKSPAVLGFLLVIICSLFGVWRIFGIKAIISGEFGKLELQIMGGIIQNLIMGSFWIIQMVLVLLELSSICCFFLEDIEVIIEVEIFLLKEGIFTLAAFPQKGFWHFCNKYQSGEVPFLWLSLYGSGVSFISLFDRDINLYFNDEFWNTSLTGGEFVKCEIMH